MPAGLIPNEGLEEQLLENLGNTAVGVLPWVLILFVNDIVPDFDTVLADLTEASFSGYVPVNLSRDQWEVTDVTDGCAHAQWGTDAILWFVLGGPVETIYGCAYYDPGTNHLRFVQRFDDDDIEEITVGGKVLLVPHYTLNSSEC